jgi:hypothetical protein
MPRNHSAKIGGRVAPRLLWLFLIAFQLQTMDATSQLYFHPFRHQLDSMTVAIPSNANGQRHHTAPGRFTTPKFLNLGALIKHLTPHARLANTSTR